MLCQFHVDSKVIQLYTLLHLFLFLLGYYRVLSIVPCAIQQVLVDYLFYIQQFVYVNPNLLIYVVVSFKLPGTSYNQIPGKRAQLNQTRMEHLLYAKPCAEIWVFKDERVIDAQCQVVRLLSLHVSLVSCNSSQNIGEVLEMEKSPLFGTCKITWMGFYGLIIHSFKVYHPAIVKVVIPQWEQHV